MTEPILHATRLRRVFGAHTAVHDVTLSIHAGQRHALIGPNGAGKTTLLNLLAGTLRPTAGSITWLGHDITRRGPVYRAQAGIGRSFQTPTVLPSLSTVDNLILAAWPHPPH
ncbi:MAG: ATP-binding cassette domain-containing protein, partial [Gammaproteobacteria bacterium]